MKKLFLVLILAFGVLASFAEAKIVKDYTLEQIVQVKNAPTKNIVEQELGAEVMLYEWLHGSEVLGIKGEYLSIKGKIVKKGVEQDGDGKEYNYVIVYFKNSTLSGGDYIKFCQYKGRNSILAIAGRSAATLPEVNFVMTERSWTKVYPRKEHGGYGTKPDKINFASL